MVAGSVEPAARSPARTRRKLERKILRLPRIRRSAPARIAGRVEMAPSTVHAVLARNQMSRLAWMDVPPAGSYAVTSTVVPVTWFTFDVKKLDKVPPGRG